MKFLGSINETMLELILYLVSLLKSTILCQIIEGVIGILFSSPTTAALRLLYEIVNSQSIEGSRILPFEAHNFKSIQIQNDGNFTKYYCLLLLRLSELSYNKRLSLEEVLSIFPYEPLRSSEYISQYLLPEASPETVSMIM